jgi:hypothetical protein
MLLFAVNEFQGAPLLPWRTAARLPAADGPSPTSEQSARTGRPWDLEKENNIFFLQRGPRALPILRRKYCVKQLQSNSLLKVLGILEFLPKSQKKQPPTSW